MFRLGHSKLNIEGHYNQICQYGAIKTEIHMFLECPSTCPSRQMLTTNVSKIFEENVFTHSEFAVLNRAELVEIVLFGHPKLSKSPSLRLFKQTCLFLSKIHSFDITSPFNTFSVCAVLFVCMCVIFLLC